MNHNHRLRAELDQHELAALQRFIVAVQEEQHPSKPRVEMGRIFRGLAGQVFVPVKISGSHPDLHLAMAMGHRAEQLYKQTGCRFILVQQLESDKEQRSYVWGEGNWQPLP
jgi:hypothetical protein